MTQPTDSDSLHEEALALVEKAVSTPSEAHLSAVREFRERSADHEQAVSSAEDYIEALTALPSRTFTHQEDHRANQQALWASLWEPERVGQTVAAMVLFVAVSGGAYLYVNQPSETNSVVVAELKDSVHEYQTQRAHQSIELEDGSTLWLDWRSRATVTYSDDQRNVVLHSGRAAFQVTSSTERPFVVSAQGVQTRVTGTEFIVDSRTERAVEVAVLEGQVVVSTRASEVALQAEQIALQEGDQLNLNKFDSTGIDAWRDGRLVLRDLPIAEAIKIIAPYTTYEIDATRLEYVDGRVSGTYFTDRGNDALNGLIQTYQLRVERQGNLITLRAPLPIRPAFP